MIVAFNRFLGLWVWVVVVFFLTGCAARLFNQTRNISDKLDQDQDVIYKSFKVQPKDLSLISKCNAPPSVKIVNIESRTEDYVVLKFSKQTVVINPKEMMDSVSLYLKKGFEKSRIKVDDQSTKVLQLKMVDLHGTVGMWTYGGYFKMELIIPKKNFSKFYEGEENLANKPFTYATYPIHGATRQIIDDPVIQDYILCR
jgi:hypothetical protein